MDAIAPPFPYRAALTDEPAAVLDFAADALAAGAPCALATLIAIRGGAARPLGAQMAIRGDGAYCGLVSGGCVEAAIAAEALLGLADGRDRIVRLGAGSGIFDIVLPCGGGITVLIHVLRDAAPLRIVQNLLRARRTVALVYDFAQEALGACPEPPAAREGWFIRMFRPPIRVVIHGHSVEADVTERLSRAAGYDTVRVGPGELAAVGLIDADSAVALLHHDLERELAGLCAALASDAFYIGALGSWRTHQRRIAALRALGCAEAEIARIKAPIGLLARTRSASALALSVLADIAAVRDVAQD